MKLINVYNDIHLFGIHALENIVISFEDNDFHIGDIIDMRGVAKKKVPDAKQAMESIRKSSKHYCSGNHELDLDKSTLYHKYENILFTHGDYLAWGKDRAEKYRSQNPGRGWLSRKSLKLFYLLRKLKKINMSDSFKKRCALRAKSEGCSTIIMGHRHPGELINETYLGVKIIILPRGKNILKINGDCVSYIRGEN